MAGAVDNTIRRMVDMRFGDIPVGKGFVYAAALGISDVIVGLLKKMVPGLDIVAAPGAAWAVRNIGVIRDFLGEDGSEVVATTAMIKAINGIVDITGMVGGTIGSLVGVTPSINPVLGGINRYPTLSGSARYALPEISLGQPYISPDEPETAVDRTIRLNRS